MLRTRLLSLCAVAVAVACVVPSFAGAPVKIKEVAAGADLVIEANAKIKSLEESLADASKYQEAKASSLGRDAGVLAVLAQAVIESEDKPEWKASAADVRDGAIAIWNSKSFEDAKKGLDAVKAAAGGTAAGAKPEAEWNKLTKLGALMKEVNARNGKLRRNVRKLPEKDDELAATARDASVLAILALVTHEDTHEVKADADKPLWQSQSKDFQKEMTAAAAAFKAKDAAGAKKAFDAANKACNDCHKKFRDKE
ncbi:MAG: cytochrome c [Planctomycetota bacterium]|nr:cytochrome c [Planctomycetota bacterium]